MPIFATLIGTLLGGVLQWLSKYLSDRVATAVALFGVAATAGVAFWTATETLISGLIPALPGAIVTAASWAVPDNINTCIACVIGTETAMSSYRWAKTVALSGAQS